MMPEIHSNTDERQVIQQSGPAGGPSGATPSTRPERKSAPSQEQPASGERWAVGLGLTVFGGFSWLVFGWSLLNGNPERVVLSALLMAILPALTCLLAGWLVRSWWGLIAGAAVYVAASALMWVLFVGGGPAGLTFLTVDFALYVVVPALALSAIGTAIGKYRARWAASHPQRGQSAFF